MVTAEIATPPAPARVVHVSDELLTAPSLRARSTLSRGSDHDSVTLSLSRISTAEVVRSSRSRTFDHDSTTRGLKALTVMLLRLRSTPAVARDHDVRVPCEAGAVTGTNRVRSLRSGALDHDSFSVRRGAESEPRSTGSACFPDHCPTAISAPIPFPTRRRVACAQWSVNEIPPAFRRKPDTGTDRVHVQRIRPDHVCERSVHENRKRRSPLRLRDSRRT